jgi:hypothetical protein
MTRTTGASIGSEGIQRTSAATSGGPPARSGTGSRTASWVRGVIQQPLHIDLKVLLAQSPWTPFKRCNLTDSCTFDLLSTSSFRRANIHPQLHHGHVLTSLTMMPSQSSCAPYPDVRTGSCKFASKGCLLCRCWSSGTVCCMSLGVIRKNCKMATVFYDKSILCPLKALICAAPGCLCTLCNVPWNHSTLHDVIVAELTMRRAQLQRSRTRHVSPRP